MIQLGCCVETQAARARLACLSALTELLPLQAWIQIGHLHRDQGLRSGSLLAYQEALKHVSEPQQESQLRLLITEVLQQEELAVPSKSNSLREGLEFINQLESEDPTAIHLRRALFGEQHPMPPAGYVEELFDDYADRFDDHLLNTLAYQVPRLVAARVDQLCQPGATVLDLGVGTGLLAAHITKSAFDRG